MATKTFCDRCDQESNGASVQETHVSVARARGEKPVLERSIELCSQCVGSLHEFLKPLPKCAEAPR